MTYYKANLKPVGSQDPALDASRPRVVLIEDNPLTVWAIERKLMERFRMIRCANLDEARTELARSNPYAIICGSPVADEHPEALRELTEVAGRRILALVSSPDHGNVPQVTYLEKPFDLNKLSEFLANGKTPMLQRVAGKNRQDEQDEFTARLRKRFEDDVCPVCIHRTSSHGCTLAEHDKLAGCPAFHWAERLAELFKDRESDRLADYMDEIQAIICPNCMQQPDGHCAARDHLDCPLDLYLGLILPIVEEELKRRPLPANCPIDVKDGGRS